VVAGEKNKTISSKRFLSELRVNSFDSRLSDLELKKSSEAIVEAALCCYISNIEDDLGERCSVDSYVKEFIGKADSIDFSPADSLKSQLVTEVIKNPLFIKKLFL
jgi:hypothetical protein